MRLTKDTPELTTFKAAEAVLKGIEAPLPAPHKFYDKDGHERRGMKTLIPSLGMMH